MKRASVLAGASLWLVLVSQPHAQPADQALFRKYLASSAHSDLVDSALNSLQPEVFTRCPAFRPGEPDILIRKPVSFTPDGSVEAGAWMESFPVRGCGNDTILHVNFQFSDTGKISASASSPGSTRADLASQHDAMLYATLGPRLRLKACERFVVTNTRFDALDPIVTPYVAADGKPLASPLKGRGWREVWSVIGCGHKFEVPLHFIPDKTGIRIVQKAAEIKEH